MENQRRPITCRWTTWFVRLSCKEFTKESACGSVFIYIQVWYRPHVCTMYNICGNAVIG